MYNLRRQDSGFCGEESHKTNNEFQFDLEDDGLDEILSQALDLFEEGSSFWNSKDHARLTVTVDAFRL